MEIIIYNDSFGGIKNESYHESNINRFITMTLPDDFEEDEKFLQLSNSEKEMHEKLKENFTGSSSVGRVFD